MKIGETVNNYDGYKWGDVYIEDGFYITRTCVGYELYEIPLYGGQEQHIGTYDTLKEAKQKRMTLR